VWICKTVNCQILSFRNFLSFTSCIHQHSYCLWWPPHQGHFDRMWEVTWNSCHLKTPTLLKSHWAHCKPIFPQQKHWQLTLCSAPHYRFFWSIPIRRAHQPWWPLKT
jgi:hypothetical protein